MPSFNITAVDPQGVDAMALLREAAIEARALYPEFTAADAPWPTNAPTPDRGVYLVGYVGTQPIACGALRPIDETTVEVRRMYVAKSARRRGFARAMLNELQLCASQFGYAVMRLETGCRQSPAIAFYEAFGFKRIAPFGEYANDPISVCFEKPVPRSVASGA